MTGTETEVAAVLTRVRKMFMDKMQDYGPSWQVLRPVSVTDQLYIKARRIRSIQEAGTQKVKDSIQSEFIGLVIYSLIGCIQLDEASTPQLSDTQATERFDEASAKALRLMRDKNHDYGEAWRDMRLESLVDLILVKLYRVKQIENNAGRTLVSEGVEANYLDICNYAIFALIKLGEGTAVAS